MFSIVQGNNFTMVYKEMEEVATELRIHPFFEASIAANNRKQVFKYFF
jgi:hypothetical protein